MAITDVINWLLVFVLSGVLIGMIFLIALLYRANRIVNKIEHLSESLRKVAADAVPAIVNMGTVAGAIQGVLRNLADHFIESRGSKKK